MMNVEEAYRSGILFNFVLDEEKLKKEFLKIKRLWPFNHIVRIGFIPKERYFYTLVNDPFKRKILDLVKFKIIAHTRTSEEGDITYIWKLSTVSWEDKFLKCIRENFRINGVLLAELSDPRYIIPSSTLCLTTKRYDLGTNAQYMPEHIENFSPW